MLKFLRIVPVLMLSILFFSGCSQNMARFSLVTTGNLPMENVEKGTNIEGRDCIVHVLGIPFGNTANRISGAVANALDVAHEKGQPSDALVNVDISVSYWSAILFARNCVVAKGIPISIKK